MQLTKARELCKKINRELSPFESYVKVVPSNGGYTINMVLVKDEELPQKFKNIKQVSTDSMPIPFSPTINKRTKTTPSGEGKWLDKPMSPANRNYDGPGVMEQRRRMPSLQDTVSRFASLSNKLRKIAENF